MSTSKTDYLRSDPTQNRQRLLDVLESIQDDVLSLDRDWNFAYINTYAAKEWGYKPAELLHRNIWEVLPRFVGTAFEANIREAMEKQQVISFEWKALYASGYREVTFFPSKEGVTMYAKNITERKQAEEALKRTERLYRSIFDNTKDGFQFVELIYSGDGSGTVDDFKLLSVNNAYEHQTGLKADFVVGKRVKEFDPNLERYWLDIYEQVDKTGDAAHTINYNENTKRWYDVYTYSLSKGKVGSLFRDITAQKNLEKQLHEQERLAAIGATAGMVGHDIRNPLQAMVSDVYLMKEEVTSNCVCGHKEELIESLDGIDQNIAYINKIVQDLQDYARPLNPEYSVVAISNVLVKVFENLKVPDSIKLSIKVKDLETTRTDPMLLQRALSNLVTNAIQAMPNGGCLEISAHPEGNKAIITVSDTGVGIPDEVKPKLFAPMVTTKSKGQGFGLAVSKRIIEALKGTISFESERGKGTKFKVELPSA